ncbi:MAG: peptidylprolyl isomerase [Deltaproteobacteria bacterium]|nr:peptidylprolyl isomerase [Deltaproteobacteria bacterium]
MKKKGGRGVWSLIMALALSSVALPAWTGEKQPLEDRIAVVNGSVISRVDFDREINRVQQRFSKGGKALNDSQLSEIKKEVLENFINFELLYQESQKKGIRVDEMAANEQFNLMKQRFPSEAEFKSMLSKTGLSEAEIKSKLKQEMTIQQFIDMQFGQKATVSDKEVRTYYDNHPDFFKQPEQVHARHILIKVDPQADESQKAAARKKLEKIQQKLQKDEDFAAIAKEFSQCPSSEKGGDLGYFKRGQMVKSFGETAFSLKTGEVSDIVETRFGYHLIKGIDKKPETTIAYEEIKDRIRENLKQEKVKKEVTQYVEKLKKKAKVEKFLTEGS